MSATSSSSHGRSRIVRLAYPEVGSSSWQRRHSRAQPSSEGESGQKLLELNGLLELVETSAQLGRRARGRQAEYELLVRTEQRTVGRSAPDGWTVLFQPEA
jgi:hypothetical protein